MDTPARKERDPRGIRVPADGLRQIAGLLVLRDQADELAADRPMQRSQKERKSRFRHTCVRREVPNERLEALVRRECLDECGEG
jgi:hypothetical protein